MVVDGHDALHLVTEHFLDDVGHDTKVGESGGESPAEVVWPVCGPCSSQAVAQCLMARWQCQLAFGE